MSERIFDPTRSYDLVTLVDGCPAIRDNSDGLIAHGMSKDDFERWQSSPETWNFTDSAVDSRVDVIELYRPSESVTARAELDALWAALGQEANTRGWCDEYDAFAEKHGGPARPPRRYNYTMPFRINLDVNLTESDTPREQWDALSNLEKREAIKIAITRRMQNAIDSYGLSLTPNAYDVLAESISRYVALSIVD